MYTLILLINKYRIVSMIGILEIINYNSNDFRNIVLLFHI